LTAGVTDMRSQMTVLSEKLASITEAQQRAQQAAAARQETTSRTVAHRRRADDSRLKKLQAAIDEQGKAIDATRADLASTGTELRGSIAKTHEELVVLQRKGERSYF